MIDHIVGLVEQRAKELSKNSNFFMFEEKLKKIVDRFDFLEKEMQRNLDRNTFEEYSKEYSDLKDMKDIISQFFSTIVEIENTSLLLDDKELRRFSRK